MLESFLLKKKVTVVSTGPYRYVRLNNILPPSGNSYVTIGEIEIIDSGSGTNWCRQSGAVASASGSYSGQPPSGAIDGVINTTPINRWSSNASPAWFMVDMGQPRLFDSIQLALLTGNNQDPVSFTIQGSTDGTNFTNLKTVNRGPYPNNTLTEVFNT